jgi:hypothetical protein
MVCIIGTCMATMIVTRIKGYARTMREMLKIRVSGAVPNKFYTGVINSGFGLCYAYYINKRIKSHAIRS